MRKIVNKLMEYVLDLKKYGLETSVNRVELYSKKDYSSCLERWGRERGSKKDIEFFDSVKTNQHKNRVIIKYDMIAVGRSLWADEESIYRECRSIVINVETEEIVILPFQKFFNVGEIPENEPKRLREEVQNAEFFEIANKLDGSMQNISMDRSELVLAGSQSLDPDQSWRVELGYSLITEEIRNMVEDNPNLTFSFEMIHEKNPHVVDYSNRSNGLYLIGTRDKTTGEQHSFQTIVSMAKNYKVQTTEIENKSLDDILFEMKEHGGDEKEGWVMYIDGRLVKLKCDDYVFLYKAIEGLVSTNTIIQQVREDKYDDFYAKLPSTVKAQVKEVIENTLKYREIVQKKVNLEYNRIKSDQVELRDFMVEAQKLPMEIRSFVIRKRAGQEYCILKGLKYKDIIKKLIQEGIVNE